MILEEIDFTIGDSDRVAIVGPNGAGKSTLLKVILGKLEASAGKIIVSKVSDEIGLILNNC